MAEVRTPMQLPAGDCVVRANNRMASGRRLTGALTEVARRAGSLDAEAIAAALRENTLPTLVGSLRYQRDGDLDGESTPQAHCPRSFFRRRHVFVWRARRGATHGRPVFDRRRPTGLRTSAR